MDQRNISDAFDNLLKEAEHIGKKDEFMTYVRERSKPFAYEPVWDAGLDCDLKCPEYFDHAFWWQRMRVLVLISVTNSMYLVREYPKIMRKQ